MLLTDQWAMKLPWGLGRRPVRGWLANRSEWRQRHRDNVCVPRCTFGHLVLIMPRADVIATEGDDALPVSVLHAARGGDEEKPSSWGLFGDRWLLVDFDRSWELDDRGLVGRMYWGNQERLARKWSKLSSA